MCVCVFFTVAKNSPAKTVLSNLSQVSVLWGIEFNKSFFEVCQPAVAQYVLVITPRMPREGPPGAWAPVAELHSPSVFVPALHEAGAEMR